MKITEATYPVFQANQVLTNAHLNDLFEYLDEQNRLTRANLIGIGLACGLQAALDDNYAITLTKGCGVTSEGYLILEPKDVQLVAAQPYTLPKDPAYPAFLDSSVKPATQYPLWELLDDDDADDIVLLNDPLLRLDSKVVVLFLELQQDGSHDCTPNGCDDRGSQVTTTLRRLLIDVADLDKINAATGVAPAYLGTDLAERLNLPDLRMPRFDVRNTGPVDTAQVLQAFQQAFRTDRLAAATGQALTALYKAFKPLVDDLFPDNPFRTFGNRFGFLDTTPVTVRQVRFLQYYWDLFDDLLAAYDELRWAGVDLLCACCPPSGLFPRHLMLGPVDPAAPDPAHHRNPFVRSPAVGDCAEKSRRVRQLFQRLVTMLTAFIEVTESDGIRITPSRSGAPLSGKAIPYYYSQGTTPPLYEVWDPEKTAHHRANQNLSYRSTEFTPTPKPFVTDPLRYDLEPNDFLRVEGHLGLDVRAALKSLAALTSSLRLPVDVIALRTGAFDENVSLEPTDGEGRFRDLETLYDTLKVELECFLVKQTQYFYEVPGPVDSMSPPPPAAPVAGPAGAPVVPAEEVAPEAFVVPTLDVLRKHAPGFRVRPGTLGERIEEALNWKPGQPGASIGVAVFSTPEREVLALLGALSDLTLVLTDGLHALDLPALTLRYERIVQIARRLEDFRRAGTFDRPGLSDRLDDIVFRCRLDPFEALVDEWKRRQRDAQQAQFLGHFLTAHPGVQHKAGVPLGGTFILVYHEATRPALSVNAPTETFAPERRTALEKALGRLKVKAKLAEDPDLGIIFQELTGRALRPLDLRPISRGVYADAVAGLADGTVVADFFLPYRVDLGGGTAVYLPPNRLAVTTSVGCTDGDGQAPVTVTAAAGTEPLSAQVDGGPFGPVTGPLVLGVGTHTLVVRDAAGAESGPVPVTVAPTLRITDPRTAVDAAAGTWQLSFTIEGGTPPFAADTGTLVAQTFTGPVLPVQDALDVQLKDAAGCTVGGRFASGVEPCNLPGNGAAVKAGYRFWLPEPSADLPLNAYTPAVGAFVITVDDGRSFELAGEVAQALQWDPGTPLTATIFARVVAKWMPTVNQVVADAVGSDQWLILEYAAPTGKSPLGTLLIDRLTSVDFTFQLDVAFEQGGRLHRFALSYTAGGTEVIDLTTDGNARVPAFDPTTSNKCPPPEGPTTVCEAVDLTVEILHDGVSPDALTFRPGLSGADQPDAFVWEFEHGHPSLSGNEEVSVTFAPDEPAEKLVRLTVFTEKGCSVTAERVIDITEQGL